MIEELTGEYTDKYTLLTKINEIIEVVNAMSVTVGEIEQSARVEKAALEFRREVARALPPTEEIE